jgi:plastocyanin
MRDRLRQGKSRRGTYVAVGMLAGCGALAGVGAAGAAQQATDATVAAVDTRFDPDTVSIETGDKVTWTVNGSQPHNIKGGCPPGEEECIPGPAEDLAWTSYATPLVFTGTYERTFNKPGIYRYYCQAHTAQMQGTIEVTGDPVDPTPTPTATATATATATVTPTATATSTPSPSGNPPVDDHTSTPPPAGTARTDTIKPALSAVRLKALRRGARVTFRLSESATVTLRFKKRASSKVVRTERLQARPGTRTVTVKSARLKPGRYKVELQARDATGNSSSLLRSNLRIRLK